MAKLKLTVKRKVQHVAPLKSKQKKALREICNREYLLIEYGTGTGKSRIIVETCMICVRTGEVPVVVIVPNSLIEQTLEEFVYWAGGDWVAKNMHVLDRSMTIYQRREALKRGNANVYLISTESLSYKDVREGFQYRKFAAALVDEASRFRNYSERTRTLKVIGKRAATRYAFTGRLLVNTPVDVFYVMNFLSDKIFEITRADVFKAEYCIMGGYMGTTAVDFRPDRLEKFKKIMKTNSIRAQLSDMRAMPDRVLKTYRVDIMPAQKKAYLQMRDQLRVEIKKVGEPEFRSKAKTYATRLQRLQEISAGFARNIEQEVTTFPSPKTIEMIEILRDEPTVPTVIWYWWNPERDIIMAKLKAAKIPFVLFGQPGARAEFISGKVKVFLGQLVKGGYGLNLPNAERMIYHSLPWDLDVMLQSQERNRRLTTPNLNHRGDIMQHDIIHLTVRGTVDEYVRDKLLTKVGISSKISRTEALEFLRNA